MKHRKKVLLIVGGMLSCHLALANSCPGQKWTDWSVKTVQREIRKSEVIFLGEVIASDGFNYSMRVIDVFKGDIASDTIHSTYRDKCYLPPSEGVWIVYSKYDDTEQGALLRDMSSLSRSVTHPLSNNLPYVLPPPSPSIRSDSAAMVKYKEEQERFIKNQEMEMLPVFLKNWMSEYAMLTAYKSSNSSHLTAQSTDKEFDITSYIALGLAITALAIVLLKK
ncbi:hypothetical protein [Pontibacter rugosus]|uniref:Tissue inhibitor of metalloproteinase n=1 Tax=Pontibacter rugosus TaxID=1745966 RepID=A0ABW3SQN5_9BACT